MTLLLCLLWSGGYHFKNATVYDARLGIMRSGIYFLVDEAGRVSLIGDHPLGESDERTIIEDHIVMPHFQDFYCLVQERGLGGDQDLDVKNQGRMVRYLRSLGFEAIRDPMFPADALAEPLRKDLHILTQGGYLELPGGPSERFALTFHPNQSLETVAKALPASGPITLWWTSNGSDKKVVWPRHAGLVNRLIAFFRERGQPVGAYIQDATPEEMDALYPFPFAFYEGMPADPKTTRTVRFPKDLIWVPLASLNDRRYCSKFLRERLAAIANKGLYSQPVIARVQDRLDQVEQQIIDRCLVWKKRRKDYFDPLVAWIRGGGALGVGSAGGHMFCFSGDLASEIETLSGLGASQEQLLKALFVNTPQLMGRERPFLARGRPAHFIAFKHQGYWGRCIGRAPTWNFYEGALQTSGQEKLELVPPP